MDILLTGSVAYDYLMTFPGHFKEQILRTMRDLIFPLRKEPVHTWNLEEEDCAWIDFIWSTLGRSGSAGQDFGLVYHVVKDYRRIKKLLFGCLDRLRGYFPSPWWIIARPLLRWVCPYLLEKLIHPEKLLQRRKGPAGQPIQATP